MQPECLFKILEKKNYRTQTVKSSHHCTAQSVAEKASKNTRGKNFEKHNAPHLKATCAILCSAYYLAQNDRPYSDCFGLLELQSGNGVDLVIGLHFHYSVAKIIDHIATEMEKICQHIKAPLVVCLKCESDKKDEPHFTCLDLIELPDQKADTMAK